jgi:hypothetical protein
MDPFTPGSVETNLSIELIEQARYNRRIRTYYFQFGISLVRCAKAYETGDRGLPLVILDQNRLNFGGNVVAKENPRVRRPYRVLLIGRNNLDLGLSAMIHG